MNDKYWVGHRRTRLHKLLGQNSLAVLGIIATVLSCDDRGNDALVFFEGRAIETVADTIFAVTSSPNKAILALNLKTDNVDTIGRGDLNSPVHLQFLGGRWYVSDVVNGVPSVKIFERGENGRFHLVREVNLGEQTSLHHQFAVLLDGRIVVESRDDRLVVISQDSVATFALTETGPRPSIVVAARGGVLHAVPDSHLTLYNAFGNIRWRTEWPWSEDAYVTDIAIDAKARVHVLAGIADRGEGQFRVYSIVGETGEVVWWSDPGERATFSVTLFGDISPDDTGRWFERQKQ